MKKVRKRTQFTDTYNSTIFTNVYKKNLWGGLTGEFYSGTGSHNKLISKYTDTLAKYIQKNQIKNIIEIGCGDFNVSGKILKSLEEANYEYKYTGYDVVRKLIDQNNRLYSKSNIKFILKDSVIGNLYDGDLLIVRQVFQHLNNKSILKIINKFKNYKHIVVSEHQVDNKYASVIIPNIDKTTDATNRIQFNSGIYLDQDPFNCKLIGLLCTIPENIVGFDAAINTYLIK